LSDLEIDFSRTFYFIRVTGEHTEGRTNEDVTNIKITNSRINRIPANIFHVFPNTIALEVIDCYNMTLAFADFMFVQNLLFIRITNNNIPNLGHSPFFNAATLEVLNLDNNRMNTLGPAPFLGLVNLRHVSIANNNIRTVVPSMLTPLINLQLFIAPDNAIEQLDGRLFVNNPLLLSVNLVGNNINAIGASFLNVNENLRFLFFERNQCVSRNFINDEANLADIRSSFGTCFDNSPLGTQITLNVVGNLTIFDENDQVLLRIA
jgi:Leucine-rich repeat (LRR) protein